MFLTVLIILGIVVAGGFLIYFVADIIMSLADKNKDKNAISQKQERERKELVDRIEALENKEELKQDPEIKELLYKGAEVEAFDPYAEEKKEEESTEKEATEEPAEETAEEKENEEQEELDAEIARRKQALMERLAILQKQDDEDEEETEEESVEEKTEDAPVEEATEEESVEEAEEEEEPAEETEQAQEEPAQEPSEEEATTVVEEAQYEEAQDKNALASTYTKDELLAKLAEEQERLKANEKDLRASKKEFIPLRRVKKTLEKDEVKLRRKEALVAKQEVLLHGVNNYSDIDEEKAKKLAEDLDLLDGLKLSVQHCQEVMDKNKERYPLLEKIYNLLVSQNAEIKENIKNLQEAIDSLNNDEE